MNVVKKIISIVLIIHNTYTFGMELGPRALHERQVVGDINRDMQDVVKAFSSGEQKQLDVAVNDTLQKHISIYSGAIAKRLKKKWMDQFRWRLEPKAQTFRDGGLSVWDPSGNIVVSNYYNKWDGYDWHGSNDNRRMQIWQKNNDGDVEDTQTLLIGHKHSVRALAWSSNGKLASAEDEAVRLWQKNDDGTIAHEQVLKDCFVSEHLLGWNASGAILATGSQSGEVQLWKKSRNGFECAQTIACGALIGAFAWHPSSDILAVAASDRLMIIKHNCENDFFYYHDALKYQNIFQDKKYVNHAPGNENYERSLAWHPNGTMLAMGSRGRVDILHIQGGVWQFKQSIEFLTGKEHGGFHTLLQVGWHPSGSVLTVAHDVGSVDLYEEKNGQFVNVKQLAAHANHFIESVAWHPINDVLVVGGDWYERSSRTFYDFTPTVSKIAACLIAEKNA